MNIIIEDANTNLTFYKNNIPFNYQKMIEENPSQYTALGARSEDAFIGIIIAKKNLHVSIMHIIYLAVSEWNSNTGVEEMLIYTLEDIARKEEIRFINFDYLGNNQDYFKYIDGILRKNNWSALQPKKCIYIAKRFYIEKESWFRKYLQNIKSLVFTEWGLLSSEELQELQEGEGVWYPKKHSPFNNQQNEIDRAASVAVKAEGKVIGWFLTQEVTRTMGLVKSIFLHEDYRSFSNSKQFIIVGTMQLFARKEWEYVMFGIEENDKQMANFVNRNLKQAIVNKKQIYSSLKKVSPMK